MSKDLSYYQSLRYKMVWEYDNDDEVYFVKFPELSGCLAHGRTEQEALKMALKVKDEWLETAHAAGWEIPEPSVVAETTGRVTLRLPKYLHQRVIDRAEEEGISQNQLILALVAQGLEKKTTESSFERILTKQDELFDLLKHRQTVLPNQLLPLSTSWQLPLNPCGMHLVGSLEAASNVLAAGCLIYSENFAGTTTLPAYGVFPGQIGPEEEEKPAPMLSIVGAN